MSHVRLEIVGGKDRRQVWGRRDEEYIADFSLVSKRYLNPEEYRLFRFHFMLGADWKLCCRQLKMDRGTFFHAVYNIQQKLGRAYRELRPYALFPLDEYFGGATRQDLTAAQETADAETRDLHLFAAPVQPPRPGNLIAMRVSGRQGGLRPPLRKVA